MNGIITPEHHKNIITRGLPKTGQTTAYAVGDDGQYEAGWWRGRDWSNNRTRFLVKTLNGDEVVMDLATGLMWARDGNAAGCNNGSRNPWSISLAYCESLVFAGFSDWRLPNVLELQSIVNHNLVNPAIWDSFTNVHYNYYTWSSTTRKNLTTDAKAVSFSEGSLKYYAKTTSLYLRAVRLGI